MFRLETLFSRFLSYFGVDPTSGDLAGEVRKWPEADVAAYLRSPYECEPETWGLAEIPTLVARPKPPGRPPEAEVGPHPGSAAEAPRGRRRRFRLKIAANREPPPRGLLSS